MSAKINFACAESIFVYQQLLQEEALFRASCDNWCILVEGSSPAIVMGAFSKAESVIDLEKFRQNHGQTVEVVRRFSAGGTVVVDQDTLFLAWILNAPDFGLQAYPQTILEFAYKQLYSAMKPLDLQLWENDYGLYVEDSLKKVVGNAQSIAKTRFVHHSSLLWSYNPSRMQLLSHPPQEPDYRAKRKHEDFLYTLNKTSLSKEQFKEQFKKNLKKQFSVEEYDYKSLKSFLSLDYRRACVLETEKIKAIEPQNHFSVI